MSRRTNEKPRDAVDGTNLLNFRFASTPAPPPPSSSSRRNHGRGGGGRNCNNNNNRNRSQQQSSRRSKEDRSSARRKAQSANFYLHSSPDHAFVLTRRPDRSHQYSFEGSNSPVSWGHVRIVKQLCALDLSEKCPICLDNYTCARITICGHCFCLPCLLHHVHSFAENFAYTEPRCPCCSTPLHLVDVRPVVFVDTPTPTIHKRLRLIKLHRVKECSTPFLPQPDQPRRSAQHAAPNQADADAAFTRFNYMDPHLYRSHLETDKRELETLEVCGDVDALCRDMAMNTVHKELQDFAAVVEEETAFMERFSQVSSGVYEPQPSQLVAPQWKDNDSGLGNEAAQDLGRTRSISIGSDSRGEEEGSLASSGRPRGDSIVSHDSSKQGKRVKPNIPSSMYLGPEESVFYQSEDGRLCFLCGFDMQCLRTEYSTQVPNEEGLKRKKTAPLPDFIEGRILEIEHVNLTPETRDRLRFLSHLPLYTDVTFVELDIGGLLSPSTKKRFAKDFQRRKTIRTKNSEMVKREDARIRRAEEARIKELKARMQRIDPNDEFFQVHVPEVEPSFDGEDFGPSITGESSSPRLAPANNPAISFSQITREGGEFPSLSANNQVAFPALGSSPPTRRTAPSPAPWGPVTKKVPGSPTGKKKKGKGEKIVLFSTGGHRGSVG